MSPRPDEGEVGTVDGRPGDAVNGDGGGREVRLPMAPEGGTAGNGGAGDGGGITPVAPGRVDVSSFRLVSTLALAGALAGLVIVLVHQWTQPRILAHQAEVLRAAIYEVLGGPDHYETAFLVDGSFTTRPAPAADTAGLDRIYVGYDRAGSPVGVAVAAAEPGFQDIIRLIFGYDPGSGEVVGMKVLEDKETPGLGAKIETDTAFIDGFSGVEAPLLGVKAGRATGAANEVDMITGATISSRAVIDIINHRLEDVGDPIRSFWAAGAVSAGAGSGGADAGGAGTLAPDDRTASAVPAGTGGGA